jgi:E3 SUMO-protein ligase PIAS1
MPQNRNTVKAEIILSADQCRRIADERLRLLMYCGNSNGLAPYSPVDVAFPNQVEVKVNEDEVKHNFKGLKNKPGTTKPADITSKVRAKPGYKNSLSVTYALTTKRHTYVVYLARHIAPEALLEKIKRGPVITKQSVLDDMKRANADPDIEATATRMSLKDPISIVRISVPVRGTVCTHIQCFDGTSFLQMMEQAPQWNCPICQKTLSFQSLCVDKYFEEILQNTQRTVEQVDVEPGGEWRVIKEEEDDDSDTNGAPGQARAPYDDDFDDELVEVIPDAPNKQMNGLKRVSLQTPSLLSPIAAFNTPPLSSREASVAQSTASAQRTGDKRQQVMIDLTLSDDEDEPPRPAKRQHTASTAAASTQRQGNSSTSASSLHTPPSYPDSSRFQHQQFPHRQADQFRPGSHSGQLPPPSPRNIQALGGHGSTPTSPSGQYIQPSSYNTAASGNSWSLSQFGRPQPPNGYPTYAQRPSLPPASPLGVSSPAPGLDLPGLQPQHLGNTNRYQQQQLDSFGSSFGQWRSDNRGSSSYSNSPG